MATKISYHYDWADLAFTSKKPLRELNAIFIAAPRELSKKRFQQLVKEYLPKGNIILGVSKEPYVGGFDEQPQFKMLELQDVQTVISSVNKSGHKHTLTSLEYFQRELPYILEKIDFKQVVLVNGSWQHVFHVSPAYYILAGKKTPYDMVSPFVNVEEAKQYEKDTDKKVVKLLNDRASAPDDNDHSEKDLLRLANEIAKGSYDYSFQTGAVLARRKDTKRYEFISGYYNRVIPFQTYAMHYGASRETYFSPPNDLNHYDTNHAEVNAVLAAARGSVSLKGHSLFINLMPCPTCARMLSQTDIAEIVYQQDHSDGYAIKILEESGKKIRRVV